MKTVFLDIDGTLVADKGIVPESAIKAIKLAQRNGHKIFLCTGRAMPEIYPFILEIGFDGIIACGGNYVITEGQTLLDRAFSREDLEELYDYFHKHDIDFYAEANSGLYMSRGCDRHLQRMIDEPEAFGISTHVSESLAHFKSHLIAKDDLFISDINKISFLGSDHPFEELAKHFDDKFELFDLVVPVFGKNSGEISIKGTDKVKGIQLIMDHYDCDHEHTIAMGDGNNDLSMLKYCEVGVAMGNATAQLKEVAQIVSDHVNEDGLAKAFKIAGLIEEDTWNTLN